MIADPALRYADIQACCTCLGFREGSNYKIDADAEASVRSLLRYLRNENADCDVRRELGRLRIVSSDLIPLLRCCADDKLLTELVIRLLMNLTQPAVVCFRQEVPKDRDSYGAYTEVDDLLKSYKRDFADEDLFSVLCSLAGSLLDRKWEERSEEDRLLIERILILVRNVLHIAPDANEERRTDGDVSVHDQLIWAMHSSGWDELLLFLGNAEDEQQFTFHTLEIISLMLREKTPEMLAAVGNGSQSSGNNNSGQMDALIQRHWIVEKGERRQFLKQLSTRHNRFGGTYELLSTPSLTERPLIYHHDVNPSIGDSSKSSTQVSSVDEHNIGIVNLDIGKRSFRKPKNRKPLIERPVHRRSIPAVQQYLQNFCWQFLKLCYNPLMRFARSTLTRQAAQENDETYYLWAMRFFMAFCRLYRFRSAYLSETLNTSTFHWIYDQVMHYREVLLSDKRGGGSNMRAIQASRRLDLAVAAYREFLTCLGRMVHVNVADRIPSVEEPMESVEERLRIQSAAAETIIANVLYVSEYQEVYPLLLKDFNEAIQSREYLRNLIEGTYIFVSLLVGRVKEGKSLFVRQRKVVRRKRGRRSNASTNRNRKEQLEDKVQEEESAEVRHLRLEYQWNNNLVSTLIQALENPDEVQLSDDEDPNESRLFDATAGNSEDSQMRSAILRVQATMFAGKPLKALELIRRLWRFWPEAAPIDVEENDPIHSDERAATLAPDNLVVLAALRQIHFTEFEDEPREAGESTSDGAEEYGYDDEDLYDEEFGLEDDDDHMLVTTEKEVQMDIDAFLLKFIHPKIVHAYTLLLSDYATNPQSTNTAVVRMIHHLAVKKKLPGSFFQLRLFHVFQKFLHDKCLSSSLEFKELANVIKYILRKFFEAQQQNNAVLIELLFFKTVREGYELVKGYGTFEDTKKSAKWSPELDEELIKLFEAYRLDPVPQGDDLGDVLVRHLSDTTKTRRQLISRLIHLDLVSSAKQLKQLTLKSIRPSRSKNPSDYEEWTEEQVARLCALSEDHQGSKTLVSRVLTDLAMDHELAVRRLEELLEEPDPTSTVPTIVVPPLRSRGVVKAKMLELGLIPDPTSNNNRRNREPKRNNIVPHRLGALNVDMDVPSERIARKKRKRRRAEFSDSDEELGFNSEPDVGMGSDESDEESTSSSTDHHSNDLKADEISEPNRLNLLDSASDSDDEPNLIISDVVKEQEIGTSEFNANRLSTVPFKRVRQISSSDSSDHELVPDTVEVS